MGFIGHMMQEEAMREVIRLVKKGQPVRVTRVNEDYVRVEVPSKDFHAEMIMGRVVPFKHGVRQGEDADSYTYEWWLFSRSDLPKGWDKDEVFDALGAYREYRGAGLFFKHHPTIRVSNSRVLVTQSMGLDI